ncbi:cell division protein FtsQ/DivIB [Glutamicibacter endophyticus]|uniref:cell division protein FtsQ/DivIB n=1 Tax=Glutamicibacter endophyticus TaxID=1522174 RepID=UPI003AEF3D5B
MSENSKVLPLPVTDQARRRKLLFIIIGAIVALSVAAVLVLSFSPLLAARNISVTGTKLVSEKQLTEKLQTLQGVPLPRISEGRVSDLIGDQPAIKELVVRAQMPDTLVVEVVEQVPVAILVEGKTRYLVSSEGDKLKKLGKKDKTKLPTVKLSDEAKSPESFALLTEVLATVDEKVLAQSSAATVTKAGFVELQLPKKRVLVWGDGSDAALKNKVAAIFLKDLKENNDAPKSIDISNPESPVTY